MYDSQREEMEVAGLCMRDERVILTGWVYVFADGGVMQ